MYYKLNNDWVVNLEKVQIFYSRRNQIIFFFNNEKYIEEDFNSEEEALSRLKEIINKLKQDGNVF